MTDMLRRIGTELKAHAPFTLLGTGTGIVIMLVLAHARASPDCSRSLFWTCHPLHVLLSALVTAGMYRLHGKGLFGWTLLIGYVGSIGIATLSDCLIPSVGESLLGLPSRAPHLGFIEKWWLVNPLALAGSVIAWRWPKTKMPHAGHVLLSTWASLFHMSMAIDTKLDVPMVGGIAVFLFLAVWIPCCTSDIAFPLLMVREPKEKQHHGTSHVSSV
jgi:hypothetical protein